MQKFNEYITKGSRYCGPFTDTKEPPENRVDALCQKHDDEYEELRQQGYNPYTQFNKADTNIMNNIRSGWFTYNQKERDLAGNIMKVFKTKKKFARNMKRRRTVARFPSNEVALYNLPRRKRTRKISARMSRKYMRTIGRKKRFRGRRKYYKSKRRYKRRTKGVLRKVIDMISPPRTVIASTAFSIPGVTNSVYYFDLDTTISTSIVHGSRTRWSNVYQATERTTLETAFDQEFETIWKSSMTKYRFANPNNFVIRLTVYEMKPKLDNLNAGDGPVEKMDLAYVNTNRFPAALVGSNSDIPATISQPSQYQGTASTVKVLAVQPQFWPKTAGKGLSEYWTTVKRKTIVLKPGEIYQHVVKSFYGRITGYKMDSNEEYNQKYTRMIMGRVEPMIHNTSNVASIIQLSEAGYPAADLTVQVLIQDIVQDIINPNPQTFYLSTNAAGSNIPAFQGPVGTNHTVANVVGNVNSICDNE